MVLFHQLCPFAEAPQHSEKGRSNPPLCIVEGVQNECGENNQKIYLKLLQKQLQGIDSIPSDNNQLLPSWGS